MRTSSTPEMGSARSSQKTTPMACVRAISNPTSDLKAVTTRAERGGASNHFARLGPTLGWSAIKHRQRIGRRRASKVDHLHTNYLLAGVRRRTQGPSTFPLSGHLSYWTCHGDVPSSLAVTNGGELDAS